jgi:hypothetical protein
MIEAISAVFMLALSSITNTSTALNVFIKVALIILSMGLALEAAVEFGYVIVQTED